MNEAVALQLAGLQAQVLWGDFSSLQTNRYDDIENFLSDRIVSANRSRTRGEWKVALGDAHKVSVHIYTHYSTY